MDNICCYSVKKKSWCCSTYLSVSLPCGDVMVVIMTRAVVLLSDWTSAGVQTSITSTAGKGRNTTKLHFCLFYPVFSFSLKDRYTFSKLENITLIIIIFKILCFILRWIFPSTFTLSHLPYLDSCSPLSRVLPRPRIPLFAVAFLSGPRPNLHLSHLPPIVEVSPCSIL